jgi:hypothetical protein
LRMSLGRRSVSTTLNQDLEHLALMIA